MSAKVMGQVWDYALTKREQTILLALADHADHAGGAVRPSVGMLAWKTGLSERTVQRAMGEFRVRGVLIEVTGARHHRATEYRINLDVLPKKSPYRGANLTPLTVDNSSPRGDKTNVRGDKTNVRGDTAVTPEPSPEPSIEPRDARSVDRGRTGLRHIGRAVAAVAEVARAG